MNNKSWVGPNHMVNSQIWILYPGIIYPSPWIIYPLWANSYILIPLGAFCREDPFLGEETVFPVE